MNTTGKVLVNCQMGMSRSSTCVLAYLILRHQMSADEALNTVSIKLVLSRASNKSLNRVQGYPNVSLIEGGYTFTYKSQYSINSIHQRN